MSLSTQPYKGARDFYPEDKRVQKYMFGVLRRVAESFGYQEYDAPIVEPLDLYLAKTSEEIVSQQTFSFIDRGGRSVTLRPEMTPTVSRMVAGKRQELSYPLRWYSIPNLWRYERPQAGRLREHWQLNVDLFGIAGLEADHEIILIANSIYKAYGAQANMYEIRVSSRMLVNWLFLEYLRLDYPQAVAMMRLVDSMHKLPAHQFEELTAAMLTPAQNEGGIHKHLMELLKVKNLEDLPPATQAHPAIAELRRLFDLLKTSGVSNAVFDITLMRGFDYYTNIVFEVFDKHPENNRAMAGGGRYDGLVAQFGVDPVPTVGFAIGDVTLQNFLTVHELLPELASETDAAVILVGNVYAAAQGILAELRGEGLRLSVDSGGRKLDSQIKSAVKAGAPYALFVGEQELETKRFKLKNLETGQEEELSLERVVSTLAARHRSADEL